MRKRYLTAAGAAAVIAVTPAAAFADPAPETDSPDIGATTGDTAETAVLPTGETVRAMADGTLAFDSAGGSQTAFTTGETPDGDRIAVPLDAVDEIASGDLDLDEFNVDALLRGEPAEEPPEQAPSETAVDLTVTGRLLDGTGATVIGISLVDIDSGETYGPDFTDGKTATVQLEPGTYHLLTQLYENEGEGDVIVAVDEVEVDENGAAVTVDGTKAEHVGFDLDRKVVQQGLALDLISYEPGTQNGAWGGITTFDEELFAIPSDGLEADRDAGFVLRQGYASPEGSAEPYSYNLFRAETDGIPSELSPVVHDHELARLDADYQSFGVEAEMERLDIAEHPVYESWWWTDSGIVDLPGKRTEYYTADPELSWSHKGSLGFEGIGVPYDEAYHSSGVLEPGSEQSMSWNNAPISVSLDNNARDWPPAQILRWDELDSFYANPWLFSTVNGGESVYSDFLPGSIRLSLNGEVVAENNDGTGVGVHLPELGDGGSMKVVAESEREADWTALGTESEAEWEFDFDPDAENPVMPVSVVNFEPSGLVNGYAEAGTTQRIELEFATQPGADDQACASMDFEVSFDDGATWEKVEIDREGDLASAELRLPDEPGFVSVRFTATDETGNFVRHHTIRSYGIR